MHVLHRFTVNFSHGIGSRCSECALKWLNPGKGQQYTAVEHGFEETKRTLATETATVENIAKKNTFRFLSLQRHTKHKSPRGTDEGGSGNLAERGST